MNNWKILIKSNIRHWTRNPNLSTKDTTSPNNYIMTNLQCQQDYKSQIPQLIEYQSRRQKPTWTKLSIFEWSPITVSLQLHNQIGGGIITPSYSFKFKLIQKICICTWTHYKWYSKAITCLTSPCQCMYLHQSPHCSLS